QYSYWVQQAGKISMASFAPHYWGHKQLSVGRRYYESQGGEGTELQWSQLIANQPDWVELVTWNDFHESTYLSPVDDSGKYFTELRSPRRNSHAGYLELCKYYITWFKSGQQPPIDRDVLFYFYRIHPKDLKISNEIPVSFFGEVEDQLYLT